MKLNLYVIASFLTSVSAFIPAPSTRALTGSSVAPSQTQYYGATFQSQPTFHKEMPLQMAKVLTNDENPSTMGIVGRGYISYLVAKLAALSGYDTWMLYPPEEKQAIQDIITTAGEEFPKNLEPIAIADGDYLLQKMKSTDALIFAADKPDNGIVDTSIINYLINEDTMASKTLKRVALLSRNLNGKGFGFFAKAAKVSANSEVWAGDDQQVKLYKTFEAEVKKAVKDTCSDDADVAIVRAGTLKGGACGEVDTETYFPQYLSPVYYEMSKKDIVTWNFLFDCATRGVKLFKGDTMPGPGGKAVITAVSPEACDGDSSRCAVGEALIRSFQFEEAGDFGVGTAEGRNPPTDGEWDEMLKAVIS